ncbi:MAG TPA: aconitate hydratase [Candidatus Bathyarchaeia archaeon]|nr:aconitate hydratase [Candidatus Bathyarchaeia archaeon]
MTGTLAEKIIKAHLVEGEMKPGQEIGIRVDRVLMQDATGTMACLQFEALAIPRPKVEFAIAYVDHNILQTGFENPDDHRFLQTFCAKHGIYFSKPGNGICHQVNLERFSIPGEVLLGSDSHTPTCGGAGMVAIGVGGLDVAVAMGGGAFYLEMPKIIGVKLTGKLQPWVTAKDIILEMLRRLTVRGGVKKIIEYYGPGVKTLSTPERSTITNMGAELGATTSIFPSDEITKDFFNRQERVQDWKPMQADSEAAYDENMEINLSELEPLVAAPGSPDNIKSVREVEGTPIQQSCIGSCVNSNYRDLLITAHILRDKKVHPNVSLHVNPGSRQVLETVTKPGAMYDIIQAGARLIENACNGCIGMGSAPASNSNSIRSFNRNWPGRSGTKNDSVYLASPETCAAAALFGEITDPRKLGEYPRIDWPEKFVIDDSEVLQPSSQPEKVEIIRGPNIKPLPKRGPMEQKLEGEVLIKVGDNISTDAIMPAGAKILPLRSNIPAISEYVFAWADPDFAKRAKEKKGGFIVGGVNYGQGSSREHAALAPMFLGIKAVLAKSFSRIHKSNLINFGIIPLEFINSDDYQKVALGSRIKIDNVTSTLRGEGETMQVFIDNGPREVKLILTRRLRDILLEGGLLNYTKARH